MHHASCVMQCASCIAGRRLRFGMLTDPTNVRSTKVLWKMWRTTFGGRRPSVEDDLHWKTTFCGKMTFGEKQPSSKFFWVSPHEHLCPPLANNFQRAYHEISFLSVFIFMNNNKFNWFDDQFIPLAFRRADARLMLLCNPGRTKSPFVCSDYDISFDLI